MRLPVILGGLALAFTAGLFAADVVPHALAQAGRPAMEPRIVNLFSMTEDEIGAPRPGADLRSRTLVDTEHGTVAIQKEAAVERACVSF